jgi:SARP family transcriptional regulator, regulator of embCAB operon
VPVGKRLVDSVRVYLTGRVCVDGSDGVIDSFPGRQGRIVFAYLAAERNRPVPKEELAEVLWTDALPDAWERALAAIVSKLRGIVRPGRIENAFGCYQLQLPGDAWVDVEAADASIHEAETLARRREPGPAVGWATVAASIAGRPFLPGEDGEWVASRRNGLQAVLIRALEVRGRMMSLSGEHALAVKDLTAAIALDPFRESTHQGLMRAHVANGNPAEALLVYGRLRVLLADELGVDPSAETERLHLDVLRSSAG